MNAALPTWCGSKPSTLRDRIRVRAQPARGAALPDGRSAGALHAQRRRARRRPSSARRCASIVNYDSYDCRGRNRVAGAKISEHGKGNAIDIRAIKLANGTVVEFTSPIVAKDFRERVRAAACGRFSTVLGPGSDGYHESHIHLDLAERRGGFKMCQWDVREPPVAMTVPLPLPRPGTLADQPAEK